MRRKDGKITDNMLKRIQLQVYIREVTLMVHQGKVYTRDGLNLGSYAGGSGHIGHGTVVWEADNSRRCQKVAIRVMEMKSYDNKIWFSHENMVQLRRGSKVYDNDCNIEGYATDIAGVYITPAKGKVKLPQVSEASVKYNAHIQVQLNYIDAEVMRKLNNRYKISIDPQCQEIHAATIHTTIRTDENTFVRNMGDATVMFECRRINVKVRRVDGRCFKQLPVTADNGEDMFLDPQTRILVNSGTETLCSLASVPVLRNVEGGFIAHSPEPRLIMTTKIEGNQEDMRKNDEKGIYADEVVNQWLDHAYLQDYQESYAADLQYSQGTGFVLREEAREVRDVFQLVKDLDLNKITTLFSLERIGGICSIIVVAAVGMFLIVQAVLFVMKCFIIYGAENSFYLAACRAMCTDLHLIQEDANFRAKASNARAEDIEMQ